MKENLEILIERLDAIAERPTMYLGSDNDPGLAKNYLYGFRYGVSVLIDSENQLDWIAKWHKAVEAHGYRVSPRGELYQMAEKGMTNSEIVLELISIEKTMFRLLAECAE